MIAVLTHRTGELCLDKDFVLIEGHPAGRIAFVMSQVAGKRLTYAELTGKGTESLRSQAAGRGEGAPF